MLCVQRTQRGGWCLRMHGCDRGCRYFCCRGCACVRLVAVAMGVGVAVAVAVFPVAKLRLQLQLWLWVHLVVLAIVDEVVAVDVAVSVGGVLTVDMVVAVAADAADQ